jgi:hypothetical protein
LSRSLHGHAFDDEVRASAPYQRLSRSVDPQHPTDTREISEATVDELQTVTATALLPNDPESLDGVAPEDFDADYASITTSFVANIPSLSDDPYADSVERMVHVTDDCGEHRAVSALLDTGATLNCISEAKLPLLGLRSNTRRLREPLMLKAAGGTIEITHVVKGTWQLPNTASWYDHMFHVVPNIPYDIILCRQVIFQQKLLEESPELCALGLPPHLKRIPELFTIGMKKLSKSKDDQVRKIEHHADFATEKQTEQSQHTVAKENENARLREKEDEERRQRAAGTQPSSAASQGTASSTSTAGSSGTTK